VIRHDLIRSFAFHFVERTPHSSTQRRLKRLPNYRKPLSRQLYCRNTCVAATHLLQKQPFPVLTSKSTQLDFHPRKRGRRLKASLSLPLPLSWSEHPSLCTLTLFRRNSRTSTTFAALTRTTSGLLSASFLTRGTGKSQTRNRWNFPRDANVAVSAKEDVFVLLCPCRVERSVGSRGRCW